MMMRMRMLYAGKEEGFEEWCCLVTFHGFIEGGMVCL